MSCVNEPEDVTLMPARNFFKDLKRYQADICSELHQQSAIFPCTTRYQRLTIKWMTHQEKRNRAVKSDGSPFTGGVLADETYMGKIVEVLACVVENQASYEFRRQKIVSATGDRFALSLTMPSTSETDNGGGDVSGETIVKCPCVDTPTDGTLVICAICGDGQHAQCVRFRYDPDQIAAYLCDDCWSVNDRLQCKATLIVVPHSTLKEWTDETIMAKLGLKSFVYHGIYYDGYIQPHFFNDYDVVVTSYNYLQMDVNYRKNVESFDETTRPRLRHARKYKYSRSPLKLIKWWRICFDCDQELSCYMCNKSEITACLESVHRWVINGTPIRTSLDNLFCIIRFLDIKPYCDFNEFLVLIHGEKNHMYSWFANVIKHNCLDDVNMELKIPKLTNEQHWIKCSKLEKRFYPNEYDDYSEWLNVMDTKPCQPLNTPLKYVNWKKLLPIIIPIVQLQNEYQYPQLRKGFKKLKKLSMMEIIHEKILQCNNMVTELLYYIFLQHNVIAGLYFDSSPNDAMHHYNTVLQLADEYQHNISDMHQIPIIHAMNMIILGVHNPTTYLSSSTYRLRCDIKRCTDKYLLPSSIETKKIQRQNAFYKRRIHMLMKGKLFSTNWYNNMFELIVIPRYYLYELQLEMADYHVNGVINIAKKLQTKQDICKILRNWLSILETRRNRVVNLFSRLNNMLTHELYNSSYKCCVRSVDIDTTHPQLCKQKCQLCKTETGLKEYEVVLFNYSYIGATEDSISTNTYEKSQEELLLSKLFNYGKSKITNSAWLRNATNHMKTLSLAHKEFKGLKELWCQRNKTNYQHYILEMSKSRFVYGMKLYRSRDMVELKIRAYGQNTNDNCINENVYNIIKHLPNGDLDRLLTKNSIFRDFLDKLVGCMKFLKNLKMDVINRTLTDCLVCYNDVDSGWAVLPCGHSICVNCTEKLIILDNLLTMIGVDCPFCNVLYEISDSTIFFTENREETRVSDVTFKGNFSIKMETITLKLMELIAENPKVKVLILSAWNKALNKLGETLELNAVNFKMVKPGGKFHATLDEFKTDSKINALLMTLSLTSKEFHLTEATRIFFVEPVINKTYEINAMDKIRRIGQTKPTFVHHFIIRDTIEEKITNVFSKKSLDDWGDVTVSQLANILKQ